ncbi:MAG: hypothetical protein IIA05_04385 [Proteobacteria bacterium]|nr:hypothetical protein [Pseudomonadota bacterium]
MSNSNKSDDRQPSNGNEPFEPCDEVEDANEALRTYNERERPLLRSRAQKALSDVVESLDCEQYGEQKRRELESAIEHLKRIVECMADEPLPCITAEALEFEDWFEYDELRYQHSVSGNMPMLLDAFVILVENGVAPGQWILDPLAEAFSKILNDRDPELVAARLKLQAKGSGSTSPLQEHTRQLDGARINLDMKTLVEEFGVSQTKAANAVIEKYNLEHMPKTLVNNYKSRSKFPDLVRKALDKHSDELASSATCWLTDNAAQDFLDSFPPSAQKYLKLKRPAKT